MNRYQQAFKYLKILPIVFIVFGIVIILANATPRGLPLRDVDKTFDGIKPQTRGLVAESRLTEASSGKLGSLESTLATKPNETCQFPKGSNQITVALLPGEWTCWIVTPVGTDYRIDTNVDADICFADDWCDSPLIGGILPPTSKHINESFDDVGIRRGIFRILGHEKGIAKITIEERQ